MKKLVFTILSVGLFLSVLAQEKKPRFSSINTIGMIAGESAPDLLLQTVNGIRFLNYFAGIGIGVDYYKYNSLPLFADARRYFGKQNKGFVYADIGYNFPLKNKPWNEVWHYDTYDFSGGIYTDIGIGVKAKLKNQTSMVFSIGHSYKKMGTKIGVDICPFVPPCYTEYSEYDFKYGRIIIKAGLAF